MYPESSNCWPTGKTLSSCLRWKTIFWFKVRGKDCLTEVPNSNIFRYKATQATGEAGCMAIRSGANCGALSSTSKEIPVGYFENSWACLTVSAGWIQPSAFPSARNPIRSLQDRSYHLPSDSHLLLLITQVLLLSVLSTWSGPVNNTQGPCSDSSCVLGTMKDR